MCVCVCVCALHTVQSGLDRDYQCVWVFAQSKEKEQNKPTAESHTGRSDGFESCKLSRICSFPLEIGHRLRLPVHTHNHTHDSQTVLNLFFFLHSMHSQHGNRHPVLAAVVVVLVMTVVGRGVAIVVVVAAVEVVAMTLVRAKRNPFR